jgi:hypothetical protein
MGLKRTVTVDASQVAHPRCTAFCLSVLDQGLDVYTHVNCSVHVVFTYVAGCRQQYVMVPAALLACFNPPLLPLLYACMCNVRIRKIDMQGKASVHNEGVGRADLS